jgi:hypothetical protein
MSEAATELDEREAHEQEYAIVINGELAVVPHQEVSYTEVVAIAYPVPPSPDATFTVTYRKVRGPKHEGILVAGEVVVVKKEGSRFDVTLTGKS